MKKKIAKQKSTLSASELSTLGDFLTGFERMEERNTGVHNISGGFAQADMFDYDDKYIDIELVWGIQSDCSNNVHTEQYKLPRKALKLTDKQKILSMLEEA